MTKLTGLKNEELSNLKPGSQLGYFFALTGQGSPCNPSLSKEIPVGAFLFLCGVKLNQYSYTDRCFQHHADYVNSMAAQGKEVREERRVLHQRPDRIGREERRKYYARYR